MRRLLVLTVLFLPANLAFAQQLWIITTYAGGGPNHGALNGSIGDINGVATDSLGNLYISSLGYQNAILEVTGGNVSRVAGAGAQDGSYLGDGSPATLTLLPGVSATGVDATGQIFIPDPVTNHIYKVDSSGIITTIAGNGAASEGTTHNCGFDGDGPALQHSLCVPSQVVPDGQGNLYVSDTGNCLVRKIDSQGNITSIAGVGPTIYGTCPEFDGNGTATSYAVSPIGIALDASGNIYIADAVDSMVRKVDTSANMTTIAGTGSFGFSGDGGPAVSAMLNNPTSVAVDGSGNVYIMDALNLRVRKVDTSGNISTIAGNGDGGSSCLFTETGPAVQQSVCGQWVAVDAAGNLYVDQSQFEINKIDTTGNLAAFAGNGAHFDEPNGMMATQAALLNTTSVATDPNGNVYFTEVGDEISSPQGPIKIASNGATTLMQYGCLSAVDGAGNVYCAATSSDEVIEYYAGGGQAVLAGSGPPPPPQSCLFNGDGAATSHTVCGPTDVVIDSSGNLYIADTQNCRIREVDTSGNMTTIAGDNSCTYDGDGPATAHSLNFPEGLTIDGSGNVYVADTGNNRMRMISPSAGTMTTIGGSGLLLSGQCVFDGDGPATQHSLCSPNSVAVDSSGNVFVVDPGNVRVRMISGGNMTTLAGNGQSSFAGEATPASAAVLNHPVSVATDASGNVYLADEYNNRIRVISQTTGFVVSASQPALTLTAGGSGTVTLQVSPANGFSGTVSFSCTGAPQGATCTPSPASENVSGTASTTYTISTTGSTTGAAIISWKPQNPGLAMCACVLALLVLVGRRSRRRLTFIFAAQLMLLTACGSSNSGNSGSSGGGGSVTVTPAGSYTITLTAASGNTTHSTTVALNVQN